MIFKTIKLITNDMKQILPVLMCLAAVLTLTACRGGKADKKSADVKTEVKAEAITEATSQWPVTEYTKLIPQPKGITIYEEHAIADDNPYFAGHQITVTDWSVADCKAYAEELKKAGFTTPGNGSDTVVIKDTESDYSFGARNSDGVYVTIGTRNGGSGTISIQVSKNQ